MGDKLPGSDGFDPAPKEAIDSVSGIDFGTDKDPTWPPLTPESATIKPVFDAESLIESIARLSLGQVPPFDIDINLLREQPGLEALKAFDFSAYFNQQLEAALAPSGSLRVTDFRSNLLFRGFFVEARPLMRDGEVTNREISIPGLMTKLVETSRTALYKFDRASREATTNEAQRAAKQLVSKITGDDHVYKSPKFQKINKTPYRANVANVIDLMSGVGLDSSTFPPLAGNKAAYLVEASRSFPAFVQGMVTHFFVAATEGAVSHSDIYDIVKVLAYSKELDEEALADGRNPNNSPALGDFIEYVTASALSLMKELNYLEVVPRPICIRARSETQSGAIDERIPSEELFVRLVPYAPVLFIGYRAPSDTTPPWLLDILHEAAHYLYWNGKTAAGATFDSWALNTLALHNLPDSLRARVEEYFCDMVEIALGGPLSIVPIFKSLKQTETAVRSTLPRRALTLRIYRKLYGNTWGDAVATYWDEPNLLTDTSDPMTPVMNDLVNLGVLRNLSQAVDQYGDTALRWLKNWHAGDSDTTKDALLQLSFLQMTGTMQDWERETRLLNPEAYANAIEGKSADPGGKSATELRELIAVWEKKDNIPDYFGRDGWMSVLQANGWSTQGPRTDITD